MCFPASCTFDGELMILSFGGPRSPGDESTKSCTHATSVNTQVPHLPRLALCVLTSATRSIPGRLFQIMISRMKG